MEWESEYNTGKQRRSLQQEIQKERKQCYSEGQKRGDKHRKREGTERKKTGVDWTPKKRNC